MKVMILDTTIPITFTVKTLAAKRINAKSKDANPTPIAANGGTSDTATATPIYELDT